VIEKQISLRDAVSEDVEFLFHLYCDTRRQEVSAWGWTQEQQVLFLRMQFDAQRRSYGAAFPDAVDHIVCLENAPAGRMLVGREPDGLRLIDIALLGEHQNQGIGAGLIRELQRECEMQGFALRLQALRGNPALRLYQRLGFAQSGADPIYVQMDWIPVQAAERL
jgi:GNAT superfamily N-acetyltransferase